MLKYFKITECSVDVGNNISEKNAQYQFLYKLCVRNDSILKSQKIIEIFAFCVIAFEKIFLLFL